MLTNNQASISHLIFLLNRAHLSKQTVSNCLKMFNKLRNMWFVGRKFESYLVRLILSTCVLELLEGTNISLKTNSKLNINHYSKPYKGRKNSSIFHRKLWWQLATIFAYFLETYISTWAYTCVFFTLVRQYIQKEEKKLLQTK